MKAVRLEKMISNISEFMAWFSEKMNLLSEPPPFLRKTMNFDHLRDIGVEQKDVLNKLAFDPSKVEVVKLKLDKGRKKILERKSRGNTFDDKGKITVEHSHGPPVVVSAGQAVFMPKGERVRWVFTEDAEYVQTRTSGVHGDRRGVATSTSPGMLCLVMHFASSGRSMDMAHSAASESCPCQRKRPEPGSSDDCGHVIVPTTACPT